jgi:hypothetical protein
VVAFYSVSRVTALCGFRRVGITDLDRRFELVRRIDRSGRKMPSLRDSVPLLWHTQDLRPGLLSATPPGLFLFFISAYPRLVPLAAFCRRFAAGTGWFGLDAGLETSGSRAALRASVVPTFRKRRERWGTHFVFRGH